MKKRQIALREILYQNYEKEERFLNQKSISEICNLSLGTVNTVVTKLNNLGIVEKKPLGFRLINPNKALQYWACTRDLQKDIIHSAYSADLPRTIENKMSSKTIFTAYSGFRRKFSSIPTDYSEVYVYVSPHKITKKFKQRKDKENIFILKPDKRLKEISKEGIVPLVQMYADLWQLPPPASRFLKKVKENLSPGRVGMSIVHSNL